MTLTGFGWLVWTHDRSWRVGLVGTIVGIGAAFATVLYLVHYRASLTRFRRMQLPEATLELSEERFRVASDVGASEMRWKVVTELWCFPDFWLLFFSRAQFMTLPTADLDSSAREFIVAKLQSHAVKIT